MPTYIFECRNCKSTFEERRAISKRNDPAICPNCDCKETDRLIGKGAGFILRGDGFYESTKKDQEFNKPMD